mgnify:CR=1 FL=1
MLYGDGRQSRDFTFVDDCIAGVVAAIDALVHEALAGDAAPTQGAARASGTPSRSRR